MSSPGRTVAVLGKIVTETMEVSMKPLVTTTDVAPVATNSPASVRWTAVTSTTSV